MVPETTDRGQPTNEARLAEVLAPALADVGYEVVRVARIGPGRHTLQIMAERMDRATMTHDDCVRINPVVERVVETVLSETAAYTLEISSPGLDRPLVSVEHYRRFAGYHARVELTSPVDGRRIFTGRIDSVDSAGTEATLVLTVEGGSIRLPIATIRKGKLMLTDELLAAAGAWAEAGRSP